MKMGIPRSFWKINTLLLPLKMHYFLFEAGMSCVLPYRTVFAKQLGVSATAVGVIFLAVPFMRVLSNPLFGFLMDYFKKYRLTLSIITVFVALSHVSMVHIPSKAHATHGKANMTQMLRIKLSFDSDNLLVRSTLNTSTCDMKKLYCHVKCDFNQGSTNLNEALIHTINNFSLKFDSSVELKKCNLRVNITDEKIEVMCAEKCNLTHLHLNLTQNSSKRKWNLSDAPCFDYLPDPQTVDNSSEIYMNNVGAKLTVQKRDTTSASLLDNSEFKVASTVPPDIKQVCAIQNYKLTVIGNGIKAVNPSPQLHSECLMQECHHQPFNTSNGTMEENEFMSVQFWSLFMLIVLSSMTFSAVIFLMDTICYEILDEDKDKFGIQRLWGTLGWGIGALVCGYLNEVLSVASTKTDYDPGFYLLAILMFLDLIPISRVKITNIKYSKNICKDVGLLISNSRVIIHILVVYCIGVLSGLIWNYQFWFLEEIGANQTLLGLSLTFECLVAELPCFIISGWVIRKLGFAHCNSLTFLCLGLKYLCFTYMYDPWMALPAGLFHGPTFGIFFASMTTYGKTEAPPGTEATVQALLATAFEGLGAATGLIIGGVGIDAFGSRQTFLYAAILSFVLMGINILITYSFLRKTGKDSVTCETTEKNLTPT